MCAYTTRNRLTNTNEASKDARAEDVLLRAPVERSTLLLSTGLFVLAAGSLAIFLCCVALASKEEERRCGSRADGARITAEVRFGVEGIPSKADETNIHWSIASSARTGTRMIYYAYQGQ